MIEYFNRVGIDIGGGGRKSNNGVYENYNDGGGNSYVTCLEISR